MSRTLRSNKRFPGHAAAPTLPASIPSASDAQRSVPDAGSSTSLVNDHHSRRRFIGSLTLFAAGLALTPRSLFGSGVHAGVHPTPRKGITAAKVLPASKLGGKEKAIEAFDMVREIPQVVDGIHCYCGCAELPDSYSLLSCYEEGGMAQQCHICQGEARLAYRLHKEGKSLEEIRTAIDERFG